MGGGQKIVLLQTDLFGGGGGGGGVFRAICPLFDQHYHGHCHFQVISNPTHAKNIAIQLHFFNAYTYFFHFFMTTPISNPKGGGGGGHTLHSFSYGATPKSGPKGGRCVCVCVCVCVRACMHTRLPLDVGEKDRGGG